MRRWITTKEAVEVLGRSKRTLTRAIDEGLLIEGVHFSRGPHKNSTMTWNTDAVVARFAELSKMPPLSRKQKSNE